MKAALKSGVGMGACAGSCTAARLKVVALPTSRQLGDPGFRHSDPGRAGGVGHEIRRPRRHTSTSLRSVRIPGRRPSSAWSRAWRWSRRLSAGWRISWVSCVVMNSLSGLKDRETFFAGAAGLSMHTSKKRWHVPCQARLARRGGNWRSRSSEGRLTGLLRATGIPSNRRTWPTRLPGGG